MRSLAILKKKMHLIPLQKGRVLLSFFLKTKGDEEYLLMSSFNSPFIVQVGALGNDVADRFEANARDTAGLVVNPRACCGHFACRQCSSLIGANHSHRGQGDGSWREANISMFSDVLENLYICGHISERENRASCATGPFGRSCDAFPLPE